MPYRHLPNTDSQRLLALNSAHEKWIATTAPADRLLTAAQFAQLDLTLPDSLHSLFKKDVGEASAALAAQGGLTTQHDTAHSALAQIVSQFIQVFNLGVARGVFPRADRAYYGLDLNQSDVPLMASHADIQLWAGKLIDGEAARTAKGGATAMAMPAIGEVAAALTAATTLKQTQTGAKDTYDKEQADVSSARAAIDALIADLWETIEFNLRKLDGPSRRRRAREWGVVYLSRPGEPEDTETGDGSEGGNEGANGNPPPASPNPTP